MKSQIRALSQVTPLRYQDSPQSEPTEDLANRKVGGITHGDFSKKRVENFSRAFSPVQFSE